MTKRQQDNKIKRFDKKWEEDNKSFNKFVDRSARHVSLQFKYMINYFMFYKPSDKFNRKWHIGEMTLIYLGIYFAIRGFMYTVFGR